MLLAPPGRVSWFAVVLVLGWLAAPGARAGDPNACDEPGEAPDVIVGDLYDTLRLGSVGGITAFAIGTYSCNVGTCWLEWDGFSDSNQHPVIATNMFRLKDGRFEQIGQSWVKHGFFAVDDELCSTGCISGLGSHLGVNCADPYSAQLNSQQNLLGPKFEIDAATGSHPHPVTDGNNTGNAIYKRLQVHNTDLDPAFNTGALYFVEGQYVTEDDAAAGNDNNNASYRPISVSGAGGVFDIALEGETQRTEPAIAAWAEHDAGVVTQIVDVPGDGRFIVAGRASPLGGGLWHYQYAIQNLTSSRAARAFSVPVPLAAAVSGIGFHDVDYHSGEPFAGTDWSDNGGSGGAVAWAAPTFEQNPNANALRWGTLYSFGFDAGVEPALHGVTLGLFRPGAPTEIAVDMITPRLCDADGTCDPGETCAVCPADCADGTCEPGETACSCAADCGAPPAVESICTDAADDDCDGQTDCVDADCCGHAACAAPDGDGDGHVGCLDCNVFDGGVWSTPGEVRNLRLAQVAGVTVLSWDPPEEPGAVEVRYEGLRSRSPADFVAATICLTAPDPTALSVTDAPNPLPNDLFSYLVRAVNDCPFGEGPLGAGSSGTERVGRSCR
jgi:hypothetical protein